MFELRPCPFCGGGARLFVDDGARVLCIKCHATTKILVDSEYDGEVRSNAVGDVIKAWNRRVTDDS